MVIDLVDILIREKVSHDTKAMEKSLKQFHEEVKRWLPKSNTWYKTMTKFHH